MSDTSRLIKVAFLLNQASLDSVHEKNVRRDHTSTLYICSTRRPLLPAISHLKEGSAHVH
jgi:hypothetical protein